MTAGKSLVSLHNATFLLGPGSIVGIGNGMILGYLMYRSGLMPRGHDWGIATVYFALLVPPGD